MEWLRVVLRREVEDLLRVDFVLAGFEPLADLKILEVQQPSTTSLFGIRHDGPFLRIETQSTSR